MDAERALSESDFVLVYNPGTLDRLRVRDVSRDVNSSFIKERRTTLFKSLVTIKSVETHNLRQ